MAPHSSAGSSAESTEAARCTEAVNEILVQGANVASKGSAPSDDGGDRVSLAESLALSDEKSLCNSFTSLDTLEPDSDGSETTEVAGGSSTDIATLHSDSPGLSGSTQSLEASCGADHQPAAPFRRQRWETRSMTNLERSSSACEKVSVSVGGWTEAKSADVGPGVSAAGNTKGSFVRKRDMWEKRSSVTSQPAGQPSPQPQPQPVAQLHQQRQKHTPDLVMDLPPSLPLSSSPKEGDGLVDPASRQRHESGSSSSGSSNSSSPGSPDMTTAAETFAMQNQNTLKKSTVKQIKKDRADSAVAAPAPGTLSGAASAAEQQAAAGVSEPAKPPSAVKVNVAPFGSLGTSPAPSSSAAVRPVTTPKIANRFPHHVNLYATPMPVLPVAFPAAEAGAASGDPSKPQLKIKPQVLKKPALPQSLNSPETARRYGDHDSQI